MRRLAVVSAVALVISAQAGTYALAQEDSSTTSEEDQLKLDKEREALRKQKLENEKLSDDIATAKLKAITDAVPTTSSTGATTMGTGAGKMESSALTAVALNGLAMEIAEDARAAAMISSREPATLPADDPCVDFPELKDSSAARAERPANPLPGEGAAASTAGAGMPAVSASGPAPVLLLAGDDPLTFAHWDKFRFQACTIRKQLVEATAKAAGVPVDAPAAPVKSGAAGGSGVLTALSVGSKLLQLLRTDWEVGTIAGTATEKSLMAAVARAYVSNRAHPRGRLYWTSQVSKLGGSRPIFGALSRLETLDANAQEAATRLKGKIAAANKSIALLLKVKTPTPWQRNRLAEAQGIVAIGKGLADGRTTYAAFVAGLAGKDGDAAAPINKVIEEAAAAELLGPTGLALNLNLETHGGGFYTRKSFIDSLGLGGPPAHVSGGAVVSFLAVRPADLEVMGAGLFTCNAGYVKLSRVALRTNVVDPGRAAACPTNRRRR